MLERSDLDKEYLLEMYSKFSKSGIFEHLLFSIEHIEDLESRTCETCEHEEQGFCHVFGTDCRAKYCSEWKAKND